MTINVLPHVGQFTNNQRFALTNAVTTWAAARNNPVAITIEFHSVGPNILPAGLMAMCIPNIVQSGQTTYATALARATGAIPIPPANNFPDMIIVIDTSLNYDYGMGPANNPHFETQALHEICHGLGFGALCNIRQNGDGYFSDPSLINLLTGNAYLNQLPLVQHLNNAQLQPGLKTPFANGFIATPGFSFATGPARSAAFQTQGSITFNNQFPVLTQWAQQGFVPFTSCDHLDINQNCLMYGTLGNQVIQRPDASTMNVLTALGW